MFSFYFHNYFSSLDWRNFFVNDCCNYYSRPARLAVIIFSFLFQRSYLCCWWYSHHPCSLMLIENCTVIISSVKAGCYIASYVSVSLFSYIFGVIIPDRLTASFQNALKHVLNRTRWRIKRPKIVCGWGSATVSQTPLGELTTLPRSLSRLGIMTNSHHSLDPSTVTSRPLSRPGKTSFGLPLY